MNPRGPSFLQDGTVYGFVSSLPGAMLSEIEARWGAG
jgi:hypothetical protein